MYLSGHLLPQRNGESIHLPALQHSLVLLTHASRRADCYVFDALGSPDHDGGSGPIGGAVHSLHEQRSSHFKRRVPFRLLLLLITSCRRPIRCGCRLAELKEVCHRTRRRTHACCGDGVDGDVSQLDKVWKVLVVFGTDESNVGCQGSLSGLCRHAVMESWCCGRR